jgi:hypothetical protein
MAKGERSADCGLQISDCGLKKARRKEKAGGGRGRKRQAGSRRGKKKAKKQAKRRPSGRGNKTRTAKANLPAVDAATCSDCLFRCVDAEALHAVYADRKLPPRAGGRNASCSARSASPAQPAPPTGVQRMPTPDPRLPPRPRRPRCCEHCMRANRMRDGRRVLWICANTPQSPGEIVRVRAKGLCPNFRPQRGGPVDFPTPDRPEDGARLIPLTKGLFATVDAEDFERLSRHKWSVMVAGHTCYAVRGENHRLVLMHREIMHAPPGMVVDHINHNGLYNRQRNLRVCTQAENCCNRAFCTPHSSRYRGVYRCRLTGKWIANLSHKNRTVYRGCFDDEEQAARARDYAAVQLHGPYAYLNFPDEWPPERRRAVYEEYQAQLAASREKTRESKQSTRAETRRHREGNGRGGNK